MMLHFDPEAYLQLRPGRVFVDGPYQRRRLIFYCPDKVIANNAPLLEELVAEIQLRFLSWGLKTAQVEFERDLAFRLTGMYFLFE